MVYLPKKLLTPVFLFLFIGSFANFLLCPIKIMNHICKTNKGDKCRPCSIYMMVGLNLSENRRSRPDLHPCILIFGWPASTA